MINDISNSPNAQTHTLDIYVLILIDYAYRNNFCHCVSCDLQQYPYLLNKFFALHSPNPSFFYIKHQNQLNFNYI